MEGSRLSTVDGELRIEGMIQIPLIKAVEEIVALTSFNNPSKPFIWVGSEKELAFEMNRDTV